jgi:hypothetical protein
MRVWLICVRGVDVLKGFTSRRIAAAIGLAEGDPG